MTNKKNITIAMLISFFTLVGSLNATAGNLLKYNRSVNAQIGITPIHAQGSTYEVRNQFGKVVIKGIISSSNTFYISTKKLTSGTYTFILNGVSQQEFVIN